MIQPCAGAEVLTAGADTLRLSERSPLGMLLSLRGKLLLPCALDQKLVDRRHKLLDCVLSDGGDPSPRREMRCREYLAMLVDTLTSSEVAR